MVFSKSSPGSRSRTLVLLFTVATLAVQLACADDNVWNDTWSENGDPSVGDPRTDSTPTDVWVPQEEFAAQEPAQDGWTAPEETWPAPEPAPTEAPAQETWAPAEQTTPPVQPDNANWVTPEETPTEAPGTVVPPPAEVQVPVDAQDVAAVPETPVPESPVPETPVPDAPIPSPSVTPVPESAPTPTPTKKQHFTQAPIAKATRDSTTFKLVDSSACDSSVATTTYKMYDRNSVVFHSCVTQADYRIFPFSGTHPTPKQVGSMAWSPACRAIFTSLLYVDLPECQISHMSLRAAAETLLKIAMDMDAYPENPDVVPTTERFVAMMLWRRDVNLAMDAGVPCDSDSQLFQEYAANLDKAKSNGLVSLSPELVVEYRLSTDGSFSQKDENADLIPVFATRAASAASSGSIDVGGEFAGNGSNNLIEGDVSVSENAASVAVLSTCGAAAAAVATLLLLV